MSSKWEGLQWEYHSERMGSGSWGMQSLGKEGWELVSVVQTGNDVSTIMFFFKRPILNAEGPYR